MAKYNLTEKKEKVAAYRSLVSPQLMDELKEKILNIILIQQVAWQNNSCLCNAAE